MEKISIEQAQKEFTAWLDHKFLSNTKREGLQDVTDEMIEAISEGHIVIDLETFELTYKLKILPESTVVDFAEKLVFQGRINTGVINAKLKGIPFSDGNSRIVAYASALTGENNNYFRVLDTADMSMVGCIVSYFF